MWSGLGHGRHGAGAQRWMTGVSRRRVGVWWAAAGCALWLLCASATQVLAQEAADVPAGANAAQEDAASSRAESFRAVEGAVEEDISGGPLMLAVYAITWLGVFLYVVRLVRLQQRTMAEVQRLSGQLSQVGQGRGE